MTNEERALREANAALAEQAKRDERFDGVILELVPDAEVHEWPSVERRSRAVRFLFGLWLVAAGIIIAVGGFAWLVR